MNTSLSRRQFLTRTAALGAVALAPSFPLRAAQSRGRLRRAMIIGEVKEDALKPLKEAGFEGVETTHICPEADAAKGSAVASRWA